MELTRDKLEALYDEWCKQEMYDFEITAKGFKDFLADKIAPHHSVDLAGLRGYTNSLRCSFPGVVPEKDWPTAEIPLVELESLLDLVGA